MIAIIICATVDASQCISGIMCGSPSSPLWYGVLGGQGFVLFVGIIFILGNLALIGYHILKRPAPISTLADRVRLGVCRSPLWGEMCEGFSGRKRILQELVYDGVAVAMFVIAGCVEAWYASWYTLYLPNRNMYLATIDQIARNPYRPQWIAAAVRMQGG